GGGAAGGNAAGRGLADDAVRGLLAARVEGRNLRSAETGADHDRGVSKPDSETLEVKLQQRKAGGHERAVSSGAGQSPRLPESRDLPDDGAPDRRPAGQSSRALHPTTRPTQIHMK